MGQGPKVQIKTGVVLRMVGEIPLDAARLAVLNALLARRYGCPFLLRIDDDMGSEAGDALTAQLDDLRWLGLRWDEGPDIGGEHEPYVRSGRSAIYAAFYVKLIEMGRAYPCFCTPQELAVVKQSQLASGITPRYAGGCNRLNRTGRERKINKGLPAALRFEVNREFDCRYDDLLFGEYRCRHDEVGDFVIRGHDGKARHVFTTTIDDALSGITHRFRVLDELDALPAQLALAETLRLPTPVYGHLPLMLADPASGDGRMPSLGELRRQGYRPEAVLNYLARLGHRHDSAELLGFDALAKGFHVSRLSREAVFHRQSALDHWQRKATAMD